MVATVLSYGMMQCLALVTTGTCSVCARTISGSAALCHDCALEFAHERTHHVVDDASDVVACGLLQGVRSCLIHALKVGGDRRAGRVLAIDAAAVVAQRFPGCTLVPLPPNPRARRRRGFDQTALLAHATRRALAGTTPQVSVASILARRGGAAQKTLDRQQRAQNLNGKLYVRRRGTLTAAPVVLIDDVYTTGATIAAARAVLDAAGVAITGVVVIAHTT